MAVELGYNDVQTINYGQSAILNTIVGYPNGFVYHRNGSGISTLRGITCNRCAQGVRYEVTLNANIAVPTGGTVGPIAVAVAIDGEPIGTSRAIVTPAAVEEYFNVTSTAIIFVPKGCCFNTSIENVSDDNAAILMQNANVTIKRLAA